MRRCFSLTELLTISLVAAVLAVALAPVFSRARPGGGQETCMANQKALAAALLLWAQDNGGKLPRFDKWNTAIGAGKYAIGPKGWDCPSTLLTGTQAAPDYFFVAGSFLSERPLAEVTDPAKAPMISDGRDIKAAKPYIVDAGPLDLEKALAKLDLRHNEGAVIAYVDGHVDWVPLEKIGKGIFLYSAKLGQVDKPLALGAVAEVANTGHPNGWTYFGSANKWSDAQQVLGVLGMTRLLGKTGQGTRFELKTEKNAPDKDFYTGKRYLPDWLDKDASVLEYGAGIEKNAITHAICWGGHGDVLQPPDTNHAISPLIFLAIHDPTSNPLWGYENPPGSMKNAVTKTWDITLVPAASVVAPLTKKIGVIGYRAYGGGKGKVIVNSIKIGDQTHKLAAVIDVNGGENYLTTHLFLVPVKPKQNITFNITLAREEAVQEMGAYLALEE
ncbi:MAG: hypothetical protein ACYC7E_20970 [Armatimonadota bacterium]